MYSKSCIIYDNKNCDECGDCNFCDLNPDKICDNCEKCLSDYDCDYNSIEIDDLIIEDDTIIRDDGDFCHDDCSCDHDDCECGDGKHHHH